MEAGGFDCVVGNPPYLFGEQHNAATKGYVATRFRAAQGQYDAYWLFIERGIELCRPSGWFSLIVPDALLARDEAAPVRRALLSQGLTSLYHCGLVFQVGVSAAVFVVRRGSAACAVAAYVRDGASAVPEVPCARHRFENDPYCRFTMHASDEDDRLLCRLRDQSPPLSELGQISRGEETGKGRSSEAGRVPITVGEDVGRYSLRPPARSVPAVRKPCALYRGPKVLVVKTGASVVATLDDTDGATMQSLYNVRLNAGGRSELLALLAVLNSSLATYYVSKTFTAYKLLFPQLNQATLGSIPVAQAALQPTALSEHLADLAAAMLGLHRRLAEAKAPAERDLLQRQVDATDRQIDLLVYELYGLTDDEIAIVEEATRGR
jgi:hypothetical protein